MSTCRTFNIMIFKFSLKGINSNKFFTYRRNSNIEQIKSYSTKLKMNTRFRGEFVEGFYQEDDAISVESQVFLTPFLDQLRYMVLKQLRVRKSTFQSGNLLIEKRIFDYLKTTYGISGAYKSNVSFMNVSKLINVRFIDETDYCCFENDRFEIRVCKQGDDSYYDENFQKRKNSSSQCRFFYRFVRKDLVKN